jgi:hypothetical protein
VRGRPKGLHYDDDAATTTMPRDTITQIADISEMAAEETGKQA